MVVSDGRAMVNQSPWSMVTLPWSMVTPRHGLLPHLSGDRSVPITTTCRHALSARLGDRKAWSSGSPQSLGSGYSSFSKRDTGK
jgi:hypothetical protein